METKESQKSQESQVPVLESLMIKLIVARKPDATPADTLRNHVIQIYHDSHEGELVSNEALNQALYNIRTSGYGGVFVKEKKIRDLTYYTI